MFNPISCPLSLSPQSVFMPAPVTTARRLAFGAYEAYEAHLHSGELTKDGKRIRLQAQPFQLLVMLLDRPANW
jgi:hypothetical protein